MPSSFPISNTSTSSSNSSSNSRAMTNTNTNNTDLSTPSIILTHLTPNKITVLLYLNPILLQISLMNALTT